MPIADLTNQEIHVLKECLKAAAYGPFFIDKNANDPFWEIHALFGLSINELRVIADKWPDVEMEDEEVRLAINNSMSNLLGYSHGSSAEVWSQYISVSTSEVSRIFMKYKKKKTFVINGDNFRNMDEFYDGIEIVLTKGLTWKIGRNLDAFNDVLRGGFGAFEYEEPIKLIWRNTQESKKRLGESDFNELIEIIQEHQHIEFISD